MSNQDLRPVSLDITEPTGITNVYVRLKDAWHDGETFHNALLTRTEDLVCIQLLDPPEGITKDCYYIPFESVSYIREWKTEGEAHEEDTK